MPVVIALAYSLLCLRLRVQLEAAWWDQKGSAALRVGLLGMHLRRDYALALCAQAPFVCVRLRNGKPLRKKKTKERDRSIRSHLLSILRVKRFESFALHVRLGLGDACETAVAAGAVQALSCAMLVRVCEMDRCDLRVSPDFSRCCLQAHMTGIFSCRLGDIILAALTAARRKRKEGLKWTSIPLRA